MTERARPLLGIVGNDVPRQLVLASGVRPRRVFGTWTGEVGAAEASLLGAADAVAARILAELRGGGYDGVVVCNDSQAALRVFYVLRETAPDLALHLLDLPRDDRAPARWFVRRQFEELLAFCVGIGGERPGAAALRRAADGERAVGAARARLRARRRGAAPEVSGAEALAALLESTGLDPAAAVERLDAAGGGIPTGPRVHLTGSSHPDADVYRAIEAEGVVIVSEDHDTGDGAWIGEAAGGGDVDAVISGLVDLHFARTASSATATAAQRAAVTTATARDAGAQAVLAFIRDLDEAPAWDLADQRAGLGEDGIPLAACERVRPGEELARAREAGVAVRRSVRDAGDGRAEEDGA